MSDIENLWGDLTEFPDMDLPKTILEAQKKHLETALGGMVLAEGTLRVRSLNVHL